MSNAILPKLLRVSWRLSLVLKGPSHFWNVVTYRGTGYNFGTSTDKLVEIPSLKGFQSEKLFEKYG